MLGRQHEGRDTRKGLQTQHTAQTLLKGPHSEEDTWSIFYIRNCPLTGRPLGTGTPGGCGHESNHLYPDTGLNEANNIFLSFEADSHTIVQDNLELTM